MKKVFIYILTIFTMIIGINNVEATGETIYNHTMNTDKATACAQAGYSWEKNPITGASYCANKSQSYTVNKTCSYNIYNEEDYGFKLTMMFLKDSGYKPVYIVKNGIEMEISGSANELLFDISGSTVSIYGWNSIFNKRGVMTDCPVLYYMLFDNPDLPDNTIELSLEEDDMGERTQVITEEQRNEILDQSCIFTSTVQLSKGAFTFNGTIAYDDNKFTRFCIQTADENCDVNNDGMVTVRYSNDNTNSIQNYQFDFNRLVLSDFTSSTGKCASNIQYSVNEDMRIIQLYSPSSEFPRNGTINNTELNRHGSAGTTEHYEKEQEAKQREKDKEGERITDCKGLIGDNTLKLLNLVLNFLMIIGPIIALVLGTYDLIVALANGEEDAKKKGIKKMKNRLVAAALLLLLPYIVKLILNIAGRGGSDCIEAMQNLSIFRSNI